MKIWNSIKAFQRTAPDRLVRRAAEFRLAGYRRQSLGLPLQLALFGLIASAAFGYGFLYALTAPFQMMAMIAPIAVFALLIVWALPPGDYAPRRTLEPLYLAFFAALVMWPVYLAIALPNLPWITLVRLFSTPLLFLLLVCISASKAFRQELAQVIASDRWVWRLLIALVILQTASIFYSNYPDVSFNKYLIYQMHWTSIFVVSCYLFSQPGFAERWTRMFIIMGYVICFYGIWEVRLGLVPWAGHIPTFLRIEDESVLRSLAGVVRSAKGIHRVQSVSTTPLGMSELLGLIAPFAIHLVMTSRSMAMRVLAAAFLPLALQLVLLADSRLGMVALLGAVMGYILIWGALLWRRNRNSLFAPALVLTYPAIFALTVTATFLVGRVRNHVWGTGTSAASTASRGTQWEHAIPKILTHPFGHGVGRAARNLGFTNPAGVLTIDSYYLTLLMDVGILGFLLYFAMFFRGVWISARAVVRGRIEGELGLLLPMGVALLNFIVVKSVFSQDSNHPAVFMMLGAVVALGHRATVAAGLEAPAAKDAPVRFPQFGAAAPALRLKPH